ncbi:hypothetical protein E9993_17980 [Labilibacter sediminis]|nr:hypothetical protein E9993_17980 [Labilibacter sediminis]
MKRSFFIISLIMLVAIVNATGMPGAISNESDSIECLKNYSIYSLNLKKKMYAYTVEPWNYMFSKCPDINVGIYSDGIKLYSHFYKKADNQARKAEVVDTIMMIYDQRIKYFGNHPKYPEGWVLGRKALDIVKYKRGDAKAMKEAYDTFLSSFNKLGDKSEDVVLFNWLKTSLSLYKHGDHSDQQFLNDFLTISTVLETKLITANPKVKDRILKVRNGCEELLVKSGTGNCKSIEPLLSDQFNSDSDNTENVKRIALLLEKLNCTKSALYSEVVEKNYELNPSHSSAYQLAQMFLKKKEFNKAEKYYLHAIESCLGDVVKSNYYYELAVLEYAQNKNYLKARKLAREAIALKGDWGKPYLLIGNLYAAESKAYGDDDFDHSTVYWIALDNFSKAKRVDPQCTEEANKQISLYSQYIPDQETGFFHGLKEGDSYTIGSWINEQTKVRFR